MPTVIQGDSVNLLPGIIRLTGMTAILSALSIPQGYGTPLSKNHQGPNNHQGHDIADPFAAFLADSTQVKGSKGLPKVEGLKGTVPLSSILGMEAMPFNRFYEVTGIAERHLPKTLKAGTKLAGKAPAQPKAAPQVAKKAQDDLTPATAKIERFIDEELSQDVAASPSVPFDEVADQLDQQLDKEANPRLVVSQKNGKTTFNRDTLTIYEDQDHVQLDVDHKTLKAIENGQMAVFIRNPDILAFDRGTMRLVTKGQGNTELYFVNGSRSMAIIPVAVEGIRQSSGTLAAAPKKLNSLNALMAAAYPEPALTLADTVPPAPAQQARAAAQQTRAAVQPKKKAAQQARAAVQPKKKAAQQTRAAAQQAKTAAEQEVELAALAARIEAEMGSSLTAEDLPKMNALAGTPGTLVASAGSQIPAAGQPAAPVAAPVPAKADEDQGASAAFSLDEDRVFAHSTVSWQDSDLTIKVGDERSVLLASEFAKPKIYPISGLAVKVVGSKDSSATDARGEVDLAAVPAGASFLVSIDDPRGKFAPATVEVVQDGNQAKEPIKLLSQKNLNLYSDLYGTIQKSWLGSACITVKAAADQDGIVDSVDGLTVAANAEADGPLYFSQNLPRPNKTSLDSHGRFCFFNIEPGLVELGIKEAKGQWITGFAVPIFAGRHLEDEIIIGDGQLLRTQVAAVPSGKTQLMDGGPIALEDYRSVDNADLLALGDQASFDSSLPSFHSLAPGYSSYKDRVYVLAKGADLETALYNFSTPNSAAARSALRGSNDVPVMTALPRGFIEDLHQELYQDQDFGTAGSLFEPSLGSAVVFFGHFAKRVADSVTIKLIDSRGNEIDTGWYLRPSHEGRGTRIKGSSRTPEGQSKAVFFNLTPGMYTAVVETEDGTWLDSKTLAVDFWTVSVVNAGATVQSLPTR